MADLAKVQAPVGARRRQSDNTDFTLPSRRDTDGPRIEVNAPIVGPNRSKAAALAEILGVAKDFGGEAVGLLQDAQGRRDKRDAAAGSLAAETGADMDPALAKRRAYADAYRIAGTQRAGLDIAAQLPGLVDQRLADEDDPATLEDINELIDKQFAAIALDPDGKPRDFGTPGAGAELAKIIADTRSRLLPAAANVIKTRMDEKVLDDIAFVAVTQGLPQIGGEIAPAAAPADALEASFDAAFAVPSAPPAAGLGPAPTGRMPIRGTTTNSFTAHRARGSVGLDLAAPIGTPVELPAGGRVLEVDRQGKGASGKFIRIDHGNGVISSYSHLSSIDVEPNQVVGSGALIGAVGNTGRVRSAKGGDGAHLHYRIKVNGKDVDPASYQFAAGTAAPATDPSLKPVQAPAEALRQRYDFEAGFMAKVPPTIDRATAKKQGLLAVIAYADRMNKPEILEGIWDSVRADGTPSFNPTEIAKIQEEAEQIRTRMRIEGDRKKRELHEANADKILGEFIDGRTVSRETLREWTENGSLDPSFAYTMVNHLESEEKQAAAETRAEARAARMEEDQEIDMTVASIIAQRQSGDLTGATPDEDLRRFNRGEFGLGKKAAARFRTVRAAATAGLRVVRENPEAAAGAARIGALYKIAQPGASLLERSASKAVAPETAGAAKARYRQLLAEGKPPEIAVAQVLKEYPLTDDSRASLEKRRAALEAKK